MTYDYHLTFSPLFSTAILIALFIAGLLAVVANFVARRPGALLRAVGLALLLVALLDPSFISETKQSLSGIVVVVLDRSGSQTIEDRTAQTDAARKEIAEKLGALGGVDIRFVDGGADDADGTRLFPALQSALSDVPADRIAGVIFVTDGQVEDVPKSAKDLGLSAPLHVFVTGREEEKDRRIELVDAPKFGIVGKSVTFTVRVEEVGERSDSVPLTVSRDGERIEQTDVIPGETTKVTALVQHGGSNVFELQIPNDSDQLTSENKRAVAMVDGVRDKLKVLLVSGEPNPGERTWRNLLKSDPNVDLVHFTILRPPEKQDGTPINELSLIAFPTADLFGAKIKDFDLIIFDRYSNQTVLPPVYLENIVRYVRGGGALLIGAGPDFAGPDGLFYSPLGQITPIRPLGDLSTKPFHPLVSDIGRKDPVTRDLAGSLSDPPSWSVWFRQIHAEATRGQTVLNGAGGDPLLVLSNEGQGRVATLLSDQIWLWARGYQGGGPYLDLLRRLAHWLMKEPELDEEALRASARGSSLMIERQTLKDSVGPVTIVAPSGATSTVTLSQEKPGLWTASSQQKELGLYRLSDGELTTLVSLGPANVREFQNVVSTTEKLRSIAEATGGSIQRIGKGRGGAIKLPRFVAMGEGTNYAGDDFIGFKKTRASVTIGAKASPLAIGYVGLISLLAGVVLGWLAESRRGRA